MEERQVAACLEALGNRKRLAVFRLLVQAGEEGLPVGDIQRALGIPPSTLSHHLARLVHTGLVAREPRGRELRCRAVYPLMRGIVDYLVAECCSGVSPARNEAEAGADVA